jgi:hypothetical protein
MKKISLIITTFVIAGFAQAQQLIIKPNTTFTIKQNTGFQFDALTLTPSAQLDLHALTISNDTTVGSTLNNTYVPNTFLFSDTFTYSGSIKVKYLEGELNGISESDLQLGVYNGTGWQNVGTTVVNTTDNYVLTTGINGQLTGELVLTTNIPLSMHWGDASAARQGSAVRVSWSTFAEKDVHHFDLYRSTDGVNWTMAAAGIPALNKAQRCDYLQMDAPSFNGKLYYRIRQTDIDGRFSFSKMLTVSAIHINVPVVVSPNPATGYFIVSGENVSHVALLNVAGAVIKSWSGNKPQYSLSGLAAGTYYVSVKMAGGEISHHTLVVK